MPKTFREQINDDLAAKKQAKVDAARAHDESVQKFNEQQNSNAARALDLMQGPLQDAVQALQDQGFTAELGFHDVEVNGQSVRAGHRLTLARRTNSSKLTVQLDYRNNTFLHTTTDRILTHGSMSSAPITTDQEAQTAVRKILDEPEILRLLGLSKDK